MVGSASTGDVRPETCSASPSPIYGDFALRLDTNYGLTAEVHQFADKAYDAAWLVALAHGAYDDPTATTGRDRRDLRDA